MEKNIDKENYKQIKEKIYSKFNRIILDCFKFYLILTILNISEENGIYDYSYIELGVKGKGNIRLYYMDESNENCIPIIPPDEMQINNGASIINPEMNQLLDNEENKVKLIWKNKSITSLSCFFINVLILLMLIFLTLILLT